jgi:nicotinamide phosphoribosyltransferase
MHNSFVDYCGSAAFVDMYKTGHMFQYPDNTSLVVSNFTARMSRIKGCDYTVHFGLQMAIKDLLVNLWDNFFKQNLDTALNKYSNEVSLALNDPSFDVTHLKELHELGYLPICIKALPEGTRVPLRVPAWTIHCTDSRFYWLVNYLETQLSAEAWKPSTVATIATIYRDTFEKYYTLTCDQSESNHAFVLFQGHDFSMRGMSGVVDAAKCGVGHLLSFNGTDTLPAIYAARYYYNAQNFVGASCPATEHAVMQAGGNDLETIKRLLAKYPTGILSIVCDTWDFWNVVSVVLPKLKKEIIERDGKLVIRPDSGDPFKILCGNPNAATVPEQKGLIKCLLDIFGGTTNSKGYIELDPHIGAIYGDSITLERQKDILQGLADKKFASNCIVLGIGSYTYQYITRDTFGMAIKATYAIIDGKGVPLFKKPLTDDGTKNSAKGLLYVYRNGHNEICLEENVSWEKYMSPDNLLVTKFNGHVIHNESFEEIKERLYS